MSKNSKHGHRQDGVYVEVKSKFDAEFRRFHVDRHKVPKFEEFSKNLEGMHRLQEIPFTICYTDPVHGDLLPINNDDNFAKALTSAKPLLRVLVQRKGESWEEINGYGMAQRKKNFISHYLGVVGGVGGGGGGGGPSAGSKSKPHISIGMPEDFRQVSAIIDVDIVPETCRRVRLLKHGSEKPLGFYIRDGTSVRVTPHGLEKVPGIFISRLVPGGLAESTGLLAVNDEVLEVNGIEVAGKSLDQVTDMMVANSSNLIITVKPANQRGMMTSSSSPARNSFGRASQFSEGSHQSQQSLPSDDDRYDQDEIRDLTGVHFDDPDPEERAPILHQEHEEDDSNEEDDDHHLTKSNDEGIVTL